MTIRRDVLAITLVLVAASSLACLPGAAAIDARARAAMAETRANGMAIAVIDDGRVRANLADGWNDTGEPLEHDERSNVRVAGSMDTTISDLAKFIAALVRGGGLSLAARAEMVKPSLHIGTAHQFPNFAPYLPKAEQRPDLAAGLA